MDTNILSMKTFGKTLSDYTFTDYYNRLMLLARSVFKWEGLPNGMNEKWIEKFLFHEGQCVVFNDKKRGLMVAQCTVSGSVNNYGEPVSVMPAGIDVETKELVVGQEKVT